MESQNKGVHPVLMITPVEPNMIHVRVKYSILSHQEPGSSLYSCYIPGFDIYFSGKDLTIAEQKAMILMKAFADHFFLHTKNGLKSLSLELHKLGFKAQDDMLTMKQLINNQAVRAKFQSGNEVIHEDFSSSTRMNRELEMQMAVA